MIRIEDILNNVKNLPTLPTVFSRLSDAIANPNITNDELAKIISSDQAASIKLLKVVNSAFYGFTGRIDSISRAILYLGLNEVRNLVLALSVINLFKEKKDYTNFSIPEFWGHSIAVGIVTRMVGSAVKIQNLENFFIAGILHDIGKLILFEYADKEYNQIINLVDEKEILISTAEKEVLGFDHSEVGELLAEKWKLPNSIKHAIRYHHTGNIPGVYNKLVAAVHVADVTSEVVSLGYSGDRSVSKPNNHAFETLNLPSTFFTDILDVLLQNYEETTKVLLSD